MTPFNEFEYAAARFGREKAFSLTKRMLQHYNRIVFLNLGRDRDHDKHLDYSRQMAAKFGLGLTERTGSGRLMEKMAGGIWDEDFLVVPAGQEITFEMFYRQD